MKTLLEPTFPNLHKLKISASQIKFQYSKSMATFNKINKTFFYLFNIFGRRIPRFTSSNILPRSPQCLYALMIDFFERAVLAAAVSSN